MKKINLKRFSLLFGLIACMFTLTACAEQISTDDVKLTNKSNDLAQVKSNIEKWSVDVVTYLSNSTDEKIMADAEDALDLGDITGSYYIVNQDGINTATVGFYNTWINIRSDLGSLVSIEGGTTQLSTETGTLCTVSVNATYEYRTCTFELTFDEDYNLSSGAVNPTYTTAEKGKKAVLNTVIGMGTVFVVLIFISFIISLFKYINVIEEKISGKGKQESQASGSVDNAIAQIVANEENEADDLELVAVIAAAIAASEGTSPDGLVVRSIIRRR